MQDDLNPEEIPNSEQSQNDNSDDSTSATKVKGKDDKSPTQAPLPTIVGKPSQVMPPKSPSPTTNQACNDVPSFGTVTKTKRRVQMECKLIQASQIGILLIK